MSLKRPEIVNKDQIWRLLQVTRNGGVKGIIDACGKRENPLHLHLGVCLIFTHVRIRYRCMDVACADRYLNG